MNNNYFSKIQEIRKWFLLLLIAATIFFGYHFFKNDNSEASVIEYDTALIQQQLKNVSKLVVTEGHFSEVITYKDSKKYLGDFISFEKKAIVVINAEVSVGFDLSQMKYELDSINKVVNIVSIPKEEIKISPDFKYYDTESSTFNEFTGADYNKINKIARSNLNKKIQNSTLKQNAQNRLLQELRGILIVTNQMKWKLKYKGREIEKESEFKS